MKTLHPVYNISTCIVSGYWNPLHGGHLSYLKEASLLAMRLIVIVNNDKQVAHKKSIPFQTQTERCLIVSHLDMVNDIFLSIDEGGDVAKSIEAIVKQCRNQSNGIHIPQILFANGGDAQHPNMQEQAVCKKYDVKMVYGVGSNEKVNSSSRLINNAIKWYRKENSMTNPTWNNR